RPGKLAYSRRPVILYHRATLRRRSRNRRPERMSEAWASGGPGRAAGTSVRGRPSRSGGRGGMNRITLALAAALALVAARPAFGEPILGGQMFATGAPITVTIETPSSDLVSDVLL